MEYAKQFVGGAISPDLAVRQAVIEKQMQYAAENKETETRAILARLDKLQAVLLECQGIAGQTGDRLLGVEPAAKEASGGQLRGAPNGFLAELNERASQLVETAGQLHSYLLRISRVF